MESFRPFCSTWRPALFPHLMRARGVFHLKYISTDLSEYWKDQYQYEFPLEIPNPNAISSSITQERHLEPHLSTFFIQNYKLHAFCWVATKPILLPTAPDFSPIEPGHGAHFTGPRLYPGRASDGVGGAPSSGSATAGVRINNGKFKKILFRTYQDSNIRSNTIRLRIRNGELSPLPPSEVGGVPMCLAWHNNACCNTNCNRSVNHVNYTAE